MTRIVIITKTTRWLIEHDIKNTVSFYYNQVHGEAWDVAHYNG